MITKKVNLIWLFISMGMLITYPTPLSTNRLLSVNFYITIMIFLWIGIIIYLSEKWKYTITKIDVIAGIILSLLYNFTFMLSSGLDDNNKGITLVGTYYFKNGFINFGASILAILSWTITFSYTIALIRIYLTDHLRLNNNYISPNIFKIFGCLMIIWAFTIIPYLPGQISWDGMRQFCEFEGRHLSNLNFTYTPTNHQPWFVTLIFGELFTVGQKLVNTKFGVFTVVLFQIILTGFIYSIATSFVWKKVGKIGGMFTFILFASPVFSTYAITIDKSTIYYALCVSYYLIFLKLLENVKNGIDSYKDYLIYLFASFLFSEFRNDSKYIVIVTTLVLIGYALIQHKKTRYLITTMAVLFCLLLGWSSYLNYKKVIPSAISESLTLPARQVSYVYFNNKKDFSKKNREIVNKITPVNQIKANYDINSGDNLKNLFPVNTFLNSEVIFKNVVKHKITLRTTKNQKKEIQDYLKLWIILGLKHPVKYVEVYLAANSKYFNPFFGNSSNDNSLFLNYFPVYYDFISPTWNSQYGPIFSERIRNSVQSLLEAFLAIPIISIFINVGFPFWWMIVLLSIVLSTISKNKKNLNLLISLTPLILIVFMYTLTPINGYSRYVIGATAVLPLISAYIARNVQYHKTNQ